MIFSKQELSEIFKQAVTKDVDDICINSNDAKEKDLFIALKGEQTDGHDFIRHALNNGAVLAISEKNIEREKPGSVIKVHSSLEALRKLAKYNVAKSNARYVGVTGSVGKTLTKNLIYHVLSNQLELKNKIYATRKNFNSQIGLPVCAATMPRDITIGIFEMGMSAVGEIKKLTRIISPSVSIISQICEAHLEFFDSIWSIAKAKSEIFETLSKQEAAIIPDNSPYTDFLRQKANALGIKNVFTFCSPQADAKVLKCNRVDDNFRITAEILGEKVKYSIYDDNISLINNSLSALLGAHVISGISLQNLADKIESVKTSLGRGGRIYLENRDIVMIDDSYNACPTSMRLAIYSLAQLKDRRKVLIMSDMRELGKDAGRYHENLSATVDKFGIDVVFACGFLAKQLFDNLTECKKGVWCENSTELAKKILGEIRNGDGILVKGSNSMKMNHIVNTIKNSD
ncbi:MAG: UDP-N-acetylmuramoyl-tripeptide--D-alanyl-D-alanine ligase [Holosporaceae bacterium]|jgi:UDP-N-acetylmuramoyl-tripeptide--D-alanyl-D-alanine ligase|nr:UDP-N-acetylmuramoyl-tripeptide--D-alanyl-D-alanine ligase [Holosporaceae bacterium]